MGKKPGFTNEQHEKLKAELIKIEAALTKIAIELKDAYGNALYDPAWKARKSVLHLRCLLDEKTVHDYLGQPKSQTEP